jgi:hypothetical protein
MKENYRIAGSDVILKQCFRKGDKCLWKYWAQHNFIFSYDLHTNGKGRDGDSMYIIHQLSRDSAVTVRVTVRALWWSGLHMFMFSHFPHLLLAVFEKWRAL